MIEQLGILIQIICYLFLFESIAIGMGLLALTNDKPKKIIFITLALIIQNIITFYLMLVIVKPLFNDYSLPNEADVFLSPAGLLSLTITFFINCPCNILWLKLCGWSQWLKADKFKKYSKIFVVVVAYVFGIIINNDQIKTILQDGLAVYAITIVPIWVAQMWMEWKQNGDNADVHTNGENEAEKVVVVAQEVDENNVADDIQPPAKKEMTRKKILR
ncbi:hypothetical protein K1W63_02740 [Weissella cibaria]|nr:hypothetical protein [Weissella cibaria]